MKARFTVNTFKKNSRVAFLGDSITAQNNYTARIAEYYITKLPELGVKFHCAGISGGSAWSALMTLDKNIFPFNPDTVVLTYGINDCNRGLMEYEATLERDKELENAFTNYKNNITRLVEIFTERSIKVIIMTPTPYAEFIDSPEKAISGVNRLLLEYVRFLRNFAKEKNLPIVDIHAYISELYMSETLFSPDRVHPIDLGHQRMAECFLKWQGLKVDETKHNGEAPSITPRLDAWRALVEKERTLYSTENNIIGIQNFNMPSEEKIEFIRKYFEKGEFPSPYWKEISEAYLENKLREDEINKEISNIMEKIYN